MSHPIASPNTLTLACQTLAERDPVLARLIEGYPSPRIHPTHDYFPRLIESIISQQLSIKAAETILRRFLDLFGENFPSARDVLAMPDETIRACGISRPKIAYIKDLAQKIESQDLSFHNFTARSNHEIVTELTAVKGIGTWTAHMFLIFCMGRLDVLPTGDLGIQNGVKKLYVLEHATPDQMTDIARQHNWAPYESVASWYIWQSLENTAD